MPARIEVVVLIQTPAALEADEIPGSWLTGKQADVFKIFNVTHLDGENYLLRLIDFLI